MTELAFLQVLLKLLDKAIQENGPFEEMSLISLRTAIVERIEEIEKEEEIKRL